MTVLVVFLSIVYVIACCFLTFVVLIQRGEGGGLGGAFGGGAVDVAFGSQADMTWKRATAVAAALFMVLAIALGIIANHRNRASVAAKPQPVPGAPAAPGGAETPGGAQAPGMDEDTGSLEVVPPPGGAAPAGGTPPPGGAAPPGTPPAKPAEQTPPPAEQPPAPPPAEQPAPPAGGGQ